MKRKGILLSVAIVTLTLGSLGLIAQAAHRQDWHRGQGGMLQHLTRTYNLTNAQQAQVKALWQSEKQNVVPLLQQLEQGSKEMHAATANGTFDEAKVNQIAQQQSQTITSLLVEKEKLQSKFYQILTPDQRAKFVEMQQRRESHVNRMLQNLAQ